MPKKGRELMSKVSRIEWTSSTWNPITGCNRVSAGCDHCYAERMARRLQGMGVPKYKNGFEVTLHPQALEAPLRWKKPQVVFVNSMSDICHEKVPFEYVERIFDVMGRAEQHVFQILTKRSRRLLDMSSRLRWPGNVWMGVTVENTHYRYRIDHLRTTGAKVKWVSFEPLLGPLPDLDLAGIDWVAVGGESGPGARPMREEWVLDIQRQCQNHDIRFFFKQWGGVNKKKTGRLLLNRTWDETPPMPPQLSLFG